MNDDIINVKTFIPDNSKDCVLTCRRLDVVWSHTDSGDLDTGIHGHQVAVVRGPEGVGGGGDVLGRGHDPAVGHGHVAHVDDLLGARVHGHQDAAPGGGG